MARPGHLWAHSKRTNFIRANVICLITMVDYVFLGTCSYCSKNVRIAGTKDELEAIVHAFCSDECRNKYTPTARSRGVNERVKRVWVVCAMCGTQMLVPPCRSRTRKYCSFSCLTKSKPGVPSPKHKGENAWNWKGGRAHSTKGYSLLNISALSAQDKELADKMEKVSGCYVREHRLIMARHLGRPLSTNEVVHHKNGNRYDNRIENLELHTQGHCSGETSDILKCPSCGHIDSAVLFRIPKAL